MADLHVAEFTVAESEFVQRMRLRRLIQPAAMSPWIVGASAAELDVRSECLAYIWAPDCTKREREAVGEAWIDVLEPYWRPDDRFDLVKARAGAAIGYDQLRADVELAALRLLVSS